MTSRSTYLSCVFLALSALPAFCTPVVYADQSSWLSAVSSPTTLTFDGAGSAVGSYNTAAGFQMGPENPTFVGTELLNGVAAYSLSIIDSTISEAYDFGSGNSLWWAGYGDETTSPKLQVTFPTPVNAISVDLMTYGASGLNYTVELNNNPSLVYTSDPTQANQNQTFFGLTSSDTLITSIDFYLGPDSAGAAPLIDNFSYAASAGDTPELSTFLLIASGLIGMALIARRVHGLAPSPEGV